MALMARYKVPVVALRMVRERTLSLPAMSIDGPTTAAEVATAMIGNCPIEHVIAIMIDGNNRITSIATVAVGSMHGAACAPRDILRAVLAAHASAFILSHNHPSGDPTASPQDIAFTKAVRSAATAVGVPLIDHVIVTADSRFASVPE